MWRRHLPLARRALCFVAVVANPSRFISAKVHLTVLDRSGELRQLANCLHDVLRGNAKCVKQFGGLSGVRHASHS